MKSPSLTRALPLIAMLVASVAAFGPGCSSDDGGGSGGEAGNGPGGTGGTGGTGGAGGSGGDGPECVTAEDCGNPLQWLCTDGACAPKPCSEHSDCGEDGLCLEGECRPKCMVDADCGFDNGLRCDDSQDSETFGQCIPGEKCKLANNCGSTAGIGDYCKELGACVCTPDESVGEPYTGVCRRRTPTCSPCQTSTECGNNPVVHMEDPAECRLFNYDGEQTAVCLPKRMGTCPAGTLPANIDPEQGGDPALAGYCVPQGGDCADMNPCFTDADCADNPAAPICDRARQICIAACKFDYESKTSQGCANGEVCHATLEGLDPDLLAECSTVGFFGQGKCDDPCETDAECAAYDGGNGSFFCDPGEQRCRPRSAADETKAACLNDRECPEPAGAMYLGFCDMKADPTQNTCVYDTCRPGEDPRAGCGAHIDYQDCSTAFKCVEAAGTPGYGTCEEKNCIDSGGAALDCRIGEFCAGEPMISLLTLQEEGTPLTPPANVPIGECYAMDESDWCDPQSTGCASDADCTGGPTNYPDSPGKCMMNQDQVQRCNWGCQYDAECPGHWTCSSGGLELWCGVGSEGLQQCETDNDCGSGNRCVDPVVRGSRYTNWNAEMPAFKVCECSATDACGGGFTCSAGVATAGHAPGEPRFEERQARYCTADACGNNGSCEWFGDLALVSEEPRIVVPHLKCAATPTNTNFPEAVACPAADAEGVPVRAGKTRRDQFHCVYSSICQPRMYGPTDAPVCGAEPLE